MSQYYYNPFGSSNDVNAAREAQFRLQQQEAREKKEIRMISLSMACAIIAYLLIQSLFVVILNAAGLYGLYESSPIFQYAFSIIGVSVCAVAVPFGIMALINRKKYVTPLFPAKKVKPLTACAWVFFGALCCVAANIIVSYVVALTKILFGYELTQSTAANPDSVFACIMEFIAMAIVPAICEEFAMRCCSLQLLKKYGTGFAVFAVSIVFGLLHGNVIQFIFAFLIGIVLAVVTVKTENILPAIFIHALNNSMSVTQNIVQTYLGDDKAEDTAIIMYILLAVLGIVSAVYLFFTKQFKSKKQKSVGVLSNGEKFKAFIFPWMIVPFILLIALTLQTVKKI